MGENHFAALPTALYGGVDEAITGFYLDDGTVSRTPDAGDTVPRTPASQVAVPVPSATSRAAEPDTAASSTEPVLRVLPLGSGLMLIGLGFGLAFVALRMRQGRGTS